jgi:hypothetical protein
LGGRGEICRVRFQLFAPIGSDPLVVPHI